MKQNNFTGYKVPKTLDYSKIEVKEDLKYIPELDTKNYYYIFYNNKIGNYAIPQNCNNKSEQELKDLKKFLNYLKSPMTTEDIMKEIFNLTKLRLNIAKIENPELKKNITDKEYDKLEKSGKFIIKRETVPIS